jgi:transcription antitermination factor NusG
MQDCATRSMLVVPDKQMDDFRRVFEIASVEEGGLLTENFSPGDPVQVTEGPLRGVEGNIVEDVGKIYVVVGLAGSVFARAMVPKAWLKIMR